MNLFFPRLSLAIDSASSKTCFGLDNEFIPVIYLPHSETIFEGEQRELIYKFLIGGIRYDTLTKFNALIDHLLGKGSEHMKGAWARFFKSYIIEDAYWVAYGTLLYAPLLEGYLDVHPLFMLCVKREYAFKAKTDPNPNYFCLVVDRSFMTKEIHHRMYINLQKDYIDVVGKTIDVVYTNDIIKRCCNTGSLLPRFSTLAHARTHFESLNNLIK